MPGENDADLIRDLKVALSMLLSASKNARCQAAEEQDAFEVAQVAAHHLLVVRIDDSGAFRRHIAEMMAEDPARRDLGGGISVRGYDVSSSATDPEQPSAAPDSSSGRPPSDGASTPSASGTTSCASAVRSGSVVGADPEKRGGRP